VETKVQGDSKLLSVCPWLTNGNPVNNLESLYTRRNTASLPLLLQRIPHILTSDLTRAEFGQRATDRLICDAVVTMLSIQNIMNSKLP
jgi:hypothetical protein